MSELHRLAVVTLTLGVAAQSFAQEPPPGEHGHSDHRGHKAGHGTAHKQHHETRRPPSQSAPPEAAFSGPEHAADELFPESVMAAAREQLLHEQGGGTRSFVGVDRLELQSGDGADAYAWEANAWIGGDLDKLWFKTEGEGELSGSLDEVELQALWSRAISPWFDFQTGLRYDHRPSGPETSHLALGLQGLAPYIFEVDVAGFLSDDGDVTARMEAEYDQRITQKLVVQLRVELELSAQDVPELELGSGFSALDAGIRLRYEFVPELAPYLGIEYQTDLGETRDIHRMAGEDYRRTVFLAGMKFWF